MEKSVGKFVRAKDKEGRRYIRVYVSEENLGGIEEVVIISNKEIPVIKEGKLYSFKRLKQEQESHYESGYADGYNDACEVSGGNAEVDYQKAYDEGYKQALNDMKNQKQEVSSKPKKTGTVKGKEGRKPALSESERAEVIALRELGKTYREIGERFGVSHQTIKNIVKGR